MPNRRLSMRKLREIVRLKHEMGLKPRQIARSCGISPTTLYGYLKRLEAAGIGWPLPPDWDEEWLEAALFPVEQARKRSAAQLPDMAEVRKQLGRKGVTLRLLWEEHRAAHPEASGYSAFCKHYSSWAQKRLDPTLRQIHKAGEKMFVDWAGLTVPVGEAKAHVFVAALGASDFTFCEAFADTKLASWIEAHVHAYEFCRGVACVTVPDNDKAAVVSACRYDPQENPTYRHMAEHYHTVILPTRPREPRDKAKVENAVQNVERWVLAPLRDRTFWTVAELNEAMRPLLKALNERPFQQLSGSRASLFEELDRPALQPLPPTRYELTEWHPAKVNIDYHVVVDGHFYSVPCRLVGQKVEVQLTARTVEILHRGKRVAMHARSHEKGRPTTLPEHRPKEHQLHMEWTPARLIHWAEQEVGPQGVAAVRTILESKLHPEQGYRSCLGLMRLGRAYGHDRLEAACRRALALGTATYRSIASMLSNGVDRQPLEDDPPAPPPLQHPNIRGRDYYQESQPGEEADHVA